jgi:hypothetical protein
VPIILQTRINRSVVVFEVTSLSFGYLVCAAPGSVCVFLANEVIRAVGVSAVLTDGCACSRYAKLQSHQQAASETGPASIKQRIALLSSSKQLDTSLSREVRLRSHFKHGLACESDPGVAIVARCGPATRLILLRAAADASAAVAAAAAAAAAWETQESRAAGGGILRAVLAGAVGRGW